MKFNFLKKYINSTIAKQLRRPNGILAGRVGHEMNKKNADLYDFTIRQMQLIDKESILEIGFGNGKFFDSIFSAAKDLTIAGLDFSPSMVKAAKDNNPLTTATGRLNLRLGGSDNIPFPDNSFDKVFCINVIYFWEQPDEHLKEIFRVLKPGGKFYSTIRTAESLQAMPFTKYGFTIYSQDEWVSLLEGSKFKYAGVAKSGKAPGMESLCIVAEKML
jgi:ubiquinone/menaquinone biosynthesis C-methylase UbiE